MKSKMNMLWLALIIGAVLLFLVIKNKRGLERNLKYSHAVIQEVSFHYQDMGIRFTCSFACNTDQPIERMSFLDCSLSKMKEFKKYIIGKELPVIFVSTNCDNSFLIFTKQIAKKLGVQNRLSPNDLMSINKIDSICGN
jgi:hypothetical protein